jgi:hypothetical protein
MNINELQGKRCLLQIKNGYSTKVDEYFVEEVAPTGNWVKLRSLHGTRYWKPVVEVSLVEVLVNLKPERPPNLGEYPGRATKPSEKPEAAPAGVSEMATSAKKRTWFKSLQEIKAAVDEGKSVYWMNYGYQVIKAKTSGEYLISCPSTMHCIGLTHSDGISMNGKLEEFFTE